MSLAQVLQHMLKAELITVKDPPKNPNTAAPSYHPKERCAYHSDSPGHDTNGYWDLKNKIQDLIDEGELKSAQDGQLELFYHPHGHPHEATVWARKFSVYSNSQL